MATLVFGVAGAAIGGIFGNPTLGWSVGTILGGYLFGPKPPSQEIGKLDDLTLTGSAYGAMIPQVWGSGFRVGGNVFWKGPLNEHKSSKKEGGKGSKKATVTNYTYTLSFAVGVCKGPISQIKRIWAEDNTLLYDSTQVPPTTHDITFYLGTEDQLPDSLMERIEGVGNVPAYRDWAYVVFEELDLTQWGNRPPALSFEIEQNTECILKNVITDISKQVGFSDSDLDVDNADQTIRGIGLTQRMDAETFLSGILRLYFSDLAEQNDKIIFIKRGSGSVHVVSEDQIGMQLWNGYEPPIGGFETKMAMERDLPFRIDVVYYDPDRDYQQSNQTRVMHPRNLVEDVRTVAAPIVMTADEAIRTAETLLQIAWLERRSHVLSLPPEFIDVPVGDILTFPLEDTEQRVRIVSKDIAVFGPVVVSVVPDDESGNVLDQSHLSGASVPTVPTDLKTVVPTTFEVWSFPAIREEDQSKTGFYVVVTGEVGWAGCVVYYSTDEIEWIRAESILDETELGHTNETLPDWSDTNLEDTTSTLDVILEVKGELETTDWAHVLEGLNSALVGNEIIGFQTANKTSDLHFTLSNLKRGWLNSEMTGHSSSDLFVILDERITRVNVRDSLAGSTVYVRCVSDGQSIADVVSKTVVIYDPSIYEPVSYSTIVKYKYQNEILLNFLEDVSNDPRLSDDRNSFSTLLDFEANKESFLFTLKDGSILHPEQGNDTDDLGCFDLLNDPFGVKRRVFATLATDDIFEPTDDLWFWYASKNGLQRAAFLYNFSTTVAGSQEFDLPDGQVIAGSARVWLRNLWLRPSLWGLTNLNTKIATSDYNTEIGDVVSVFTSPINSPIATPFRYTIKLVTGDTYVDLPVTPVLYSGKRSFILLVNGILDHAATLTNDGSGFPRRVNLSDPTGIDGLVADVMGYA